MNWSDTRMAEKSRVEIKSHHKYTVELPPIRHRIEIHGGIFVNVFLVTAALWLFFSILE